MMAATFRLNARQAGQATLSAIRRQLRRQRAESHQGVFLLWVQGLPTKTGARNHHLNSAYGRALRKQSSTRRYVLTFARALHQTMTLIELLTVVWIEMYLRMCLF
jgi:hypothetical protein